MQNYVTEEILKGFLGGCLPIYYGTTQIFDIFNSDSFIFYDVENPQPALDLIYKLEANESEYKHMLSVPILKDCNKTINQYLSILPNIGDGHVNSRIRDMMGLSPFVQAG